MMLRALAVLLPLTLAAAPSRVHTVSAYCPCALCCGEANRPAANGHMPLPGVTVAGPRWVPLGTKVYIEGIGIRVVTDRLARPFDNRFDVFVSTHHQAKAFGLQQHRITVIAWPKQ
jgi:3D (Asp-Asp-Asp) domain-containing protein